MAAGAPHKHCRTVAMQFHNGVVVAARAGELDAHPYLLSVGARYVKQTANSGIMARFSNRHQLAWNELLTSHTLFLAAVRVWRGGAVIRRVSVLGVLENVDQVSTGVHSLHTHKREPATF
jgi:hypothetical protein